MAAIRVVIFIVQMCRQINKIYRISHGAHSAVWGNDIKNTQYTIKYKMAIGQVKAMKRRLFTNGVI